MIAAARRRATVARVRAEAFTRAADRRLNALLVEAPRVGAWTRAADRRLNRVLAGLWPRLAAVGKRVRRVVVPPARRLGRRLRPLGVFLLRRLAWLERRLLRVWALAMGAAKRVAAEVSPHRAICLAILACAALLVVVQFLEYRAVEIGQAGYAGLPAAEAPTEGGKTAGEAHAYLLVPVGVLAGVLALAALRNERRRGLGRIVLALGAVALAVALLVDLPAGLDASAESARFSGAEAVLYDGFYAEIAAAAGLMLGGVLLLKVHRVSTRHGDRPRKPSLARTQGGRRRARTSGA